MNLKLATLALLYAKIGATENANPTGLRFKKESDETARTLQSTCGQYKQMFKLQLHYFNVYLLHYLTLSYHFCHF